MEDPKGLWNDRLPEEITFWRYWLRQSDPAFRADFAERMTPDRPMPPYIGKILDAMGPNGQDEYRVLDVGSGPLTALGSRHGARRVRVIPVDPLADYYDELLEEAGVVPLVRATWCHGELLRERFPAASFEMTYAQNSLDHSYDPLAVIRQMVDLTKPGGTVLLEHARNEGETREYKGLHQWNFDLEGERAFLWNARQRVCLNEVLGDRVTVVPWYQPDVNWLNIQLRVRAPEPAAPSAPPRRAWGQRWRRPPRGA